MRDRENAGTDGATLARELTARADASIVELFQGSFLKGLDHWCIVAVGGYGREELCPFSDVDILFLMEKKTSRDEIEKALKELLYPLWDAGFNASYSVRTIKQVLADARDDFFFRTCIIDSRFVCGSKTVFEKYAQALSRDRFLKNTRRYVADLAFHTAKRHEKYGDAVYFLEPHIKDGHGGLRDYQSIIWVLKVLEGSASGQMPISRQDLDELHEAGIFMLKTRFLLHGLTGRKTDQMFLEFQEPLAEELGYRDSGKASPVEDFLKDFHTMAMTIRTVIDSLLLFLEQPKGIGLLLSPKNRGEVFTLSSGLLDFTRPEDMIRDPLLVMKAFAFMGEKGLKLSPVARSLIKEFVRSNKALERNSEACRMLLAILQSRYAESTLVSMLETGVLEQLIPELATIKGKAIFDVYHTFTVDLHSIHTVSELQRLEASEPEAFARVLDRDALFFAAFMHDIGKGSGSPHAERGASMIEPIARVFGFDDEGVDTVVSLIGHHLDLADIASKRDLSEEKVINDLAQMVGNTQRLAMLYLLTLADTKATGPSAWNEWKASLFWELYTRTHNILEKGIMKSRKNAMRLEEKWHSLVRLTETEDGAMISGRLWALPQAYVLSSDFEDIRRHIGLSSRLAGPDDIEVEISHRRNHTQITLVTRDRPGLFTLLTGVLAINRMDIISANIFTWYDGTVVDTFKVIPPWHDYREWDGVEKQLREFMAGEPDVGSRIRKTRALKCESPSPVQSDSHVTVSIDNDTSDFFTIIDVKAHRRIGLTHDISRALSSSALNIHRAFLSRNSDLTSSVFYVVDAGGEKIMDEGIQQEVIEHIRNAVQAQRFPSSPGDEKKLYSKGREMNALRES